MIILDWIRRRPFTVVVVIVVVGFAVAFGVLRGHFTGNFSSVVVLDPGSARHWNWWSLLTSIVLVKDIPQLVLVVLAALFGLGYAERLIGTWRTVVAFVVTGIAGTLIGLLILLIAEASGSFWSAAVHSLVVVDPLTPIAGALGWASASAGPLWRRRLRIIIVAGNIMLFLYTGHPAYLYGLAGAIVGVGIGAVLTRHAHRPASWRSSDHETRLQLALVAVIFAIGPVVTLLSPTHAGLLSPFALLLTDGLGGVLPDAAPCAVRHVSDECLAAVARVRLHGWGSSIVTVLPLVVVLVCARGLVRGRRAAVWVLAIISGLLGGLAGWYFGFIPASGQPWAIPITPSRNGDVAVPLVLSAVLPVVFAVVLLTQARRFPVRVRPSLIARLIAAIAASVAVASLLYVGLGWVLRTQFSYGVTVTDLLLDLPERLIPISFLVHERVEFAPQSPATLLLYDGVGVIVWVTLLVCVLIALHGGFSLRRSSHNPLLVRSLLVSAGGGSLSYMATWAGNRYWISADASAAIAYRIANGFAVTTSDPIGTGGRHIEVLLEFTRYCDQHGWSPIFYSVHALWRDELVALGWSSLIVAEESLLDPLEWSPSGHRGKDVRTATNRAEREDVRVEWTRWVDLSPRVATQIEEMSEEWVITKAAPEMGFTLGGLDELRDRNVALSVARSAQGQVQAVMSWLPVWREGRISGYTLDFMRRRPDAMSGVMELMIADACEQLKSRGIGNLSLSGSPLATGSDDAGAGALSRVLTLMARVLEPVYGFRSLQKFKKKFAPTVEPLYLVYPDPLALSAIGLAIARCYLPSFGPRQVRAILRGAP